jgi:hypothetical protein
MPRKTSKLRIVALQVANARRIVAEQQALVTELHAFGQPTIEAEATLRTYLSSLRTSCRHGRRPRYRRQGSIARSCNDDVPNFSKLRSENDTSVFAETSRCRLLIGCDHLNANSTRRRVESPLEGQRL